MRNGIGKAFHHVTVVEQAHIRRYLYHPSMGWADLNSVGIPYPWLADRRELGAYVDTGLGAFGCMCHSRTFVIFQRAPKNVTPYSAMIWAPFAIMLSGLSPFDQIRLQQDCYTPQLGPWCRHPRDQHILRPSPLRAHPHGPQSFRSGSTVVRTSASTPALLLWTTSPVAFVAIDPWHALLACCLCQHVTGHPRRTRGRSLFLRCQQGTAAVDVGY